MQCHGILFAIRSAIIKENSGPFRRFYRDVGFGENGLSPFFYCIKVHDQSSDPLSGLLKMNDMARELLLEIIKVGSELSSNTIVENLQNLPMF